MFGRDLASGAQGAFVVSAGDEIGRVCLWLVGASDQRRGDRDQPVFV